MVQKYGLHEPTLLQRSNSTATLGGVSAQTIVVLRSWRASVPDRPGHPRPSWNSGKSTSCSGECYAGRHVTPAENSWPNYLIRKRSSGFPPRKQTEYSVWSTYKLPSSICGSNGRFMKGLGVFFSTVVVTCTVMSCSYADGQLQHARLAIRHPVCLKPFVRWRTGLAHPLGTIFVDGLLEEHDRLQESVLGRRTRLIHDPVPRLPAPPWYPGHIP